MFLTPRFLLWVASDEEVLSTIRVASRGTERCFPEGLQVLDGVAVLGLKLEGLVSQSAWPEIPRCEAPPLRPSWWPRRSVREAPYCADSGQEDHIKHWSSSGTNPAP